MNTNAREDRSEDPLYLRAWRERRGWSEERLANVTGFSKATISNWENGKNAPTLEKLIEHDKHLRADGALIDLVRALAHPSSKVRSPRSRWWVNFEPPGGPVWIWARNPAHAQVQIVAFRWGHFSGSFEVPSEGVFVECPISVANPPLILTFSREGWLDYGRGTIPSSFNLKVLDGLNQVQRIDVRDATAQFFRTEISRLLGRDSLVEGHLKRFVAKRIDLIEQLMLPSGMGAESLELTSARAANPDPTSVARNPPRAPAEPLVRLTGGSYGQIRAEQMISREGAARAVSEMLVSSPVTGKQIKSFEQDHEPREVVGLRARLDRLYRLDGVSVCEEVKTQLVENVWRIAIPSYWRGPVWIRLEDDGAERANPAWIESHGWRRDITAGDDLVFSFRSPSGDPGFTAAVPPGWRVWAGIGVVESAIDVNDSWVPINDFIMRRMFDAFGPVYPVLFGRSLADVRRLVALARAGRNSGA